MSNVIGFKCFDCARQFRSAEVEYVCAACGGNLDVLYDYTAVGAQLTKARLAADRHLSMWRYRPLLPIAELSPVPPLAVGYFAEERLGVVGERSRLQRPGQHRLTDAATG